MVHLIILLSYIQIIIHINFDFTACFSPCSFLSGVSHSRLSLATHSRSHSDISAIIPIKSQYNNTRQDSIQTKDKGAMSNSERQYMSQLDLSVSDRDKPLSLFEQIQLKKSQTNSGDAKTNGGLKNTKVFRQDSGLGTLSTIS